MTRATFEGTVEAEALAAGFATRLRRWARAAGVAEATAEFVAGAGAVVARDTVDGHVCVPLTAVLGDRTMSLESARAMLLASTLVATPEARATAPLLIDPDDRLYLHRYYDYEERLARRLRAASARPWEPLEADGSERLAALLEPLTVGQRLAVHLALARHLTIVSGGPGTGKTTSVATLLAALIERTPDLRIALVAPTGKAAARMTESMARQLTRFTPDVQARLGAIRASTVHRLLGSLPGGGFRHDAKRLLPLDVLVVDEASMLDLALATHLLEAVPPSARIILLGDRDQLEAVESGAVFAELCLSNGLSAEARTALESTGLTVDAAVPTIGPEDLLPDSVVFLTESRRFHADSDIGHLATAIRTGDGARAQALLEEPDRPVRWIASEERRLPSEALRDMHAGFNAYLAQVRASPHDVRALFRAFSAFRVLSATREGPRGVRRINDLLDRHARATITGQPRGESPWYAGKPILITRNDPLLGLFNGDVGLVLPDERGHLWAYFENEQAEPRAVSTAQLPAHETAFAMTIHKSQGSEFESVLVLLPGEASRVLSRELLYTGVTRAVTRMTLCAPPAVLADTIARRSARQSGLRSRLLDLATHRDEPALR